MQQIDVPISIHAPREGCDNDVAANYFDRIIISIHAPREGCDGRNDMDDETAEEFQSTHPVRGATTPVIPAFYWNANFNPRTP